MKSSKDTKSKNIRKKILKVIAEHIGVEVSEIKDEDIFTEDLHVYANDLTDILEKISQLGIDISKIDFEEVDTVGDLVEILTNEEEF